MKGPEEQLTCHHGEVHKPGFLVGVPVQPVPPLSLPGSFSAGSDRNHAHPAYRHDREDTAKVRVKSITISCEVSHTPLLLARVLIGPD